MYLGLAGSLEPAVPRYFQIVVFENNKHFYKQSLSYIIYFNILILNSTKISFVMTYKPKLIVFTSCHYTNTATKMLQFCTYLKCQILLKEEVNFYPV